MKIYARLFVITLFLFLIVFSCKDSFLETKPYGALGEKSLTESESGADAILISAYSNLDGFSGWDNSTPWGGAASNWTFGSIAGGDAYKGSEANDQPEITPIELHTLDANNPYLEGKWRNYYDGISRTNKAINSFKGLTAAAISEINRSTRLGEAKFLRAFYHYELFKVFKNVPYITEDLLDVRIGNDKDVLPLIQADLNEAVNSLPLTQPEPGRATKGAAQAYLGLTYLWQKDYSNAKAQFDAVIGSGRYALDDIFHENFNAAFRNTSESILEVQQAVNVGTDDNSNNGDVLNFPYNGGPGGCCGFHQPSQNLVNAFKTDAGGLPLLDTYNNTDFKSDNLVSSFSLPATGGHSVGEMINDNYSPDFVTTVDPRLDYTV
ncbi:MAG: RagB/SusD family nutrient uptake outer membrane protein [Cyclobacteriaceae bacterium]